MKPFHTTTVGGGALDAPSAKCDLDGHILPLTGLPPDGGRDVEGAIPYNPNMHRRNTMLPEAFLSRLKCQLGDEYDDYLRSLDRPRAVALRFNPLKTNNYPALPFVEEAVSWADYGYYYTPDARPGLHVWHEAGLYYLQEASAMAPVTLLAPQPGELVLDLCAAPGGKTTQIAGLMGGEGLLVCNELSPKRAKILSRNIERMAVPNALVLNHHPKELERHFAGCFDRVLVDAPCSGEGMFRKEEAAVTDWSEETVQMCAERQAQILATAAKLLRPGGRLVYSTCTFAPAEDEGAVTAFLNAHPDFSIEAVSAPALSPGCPDCIDDPAPGIEHTFRLWPHHQTGEGHYAAVLRKSGDEESVLVPSNPEKLPKEWTDFAKSMGITLPAGKPALFGSTLWWLPENAPELKGLKVLRPGLELGEVKKGRFEPAHALALWLKTCASVQDYAPDSPEMAAYIHGDVVPSEKKGWTLVTAGGLSIGWGKGDGKILKNHYPKGLRR